MSKNNIKAALFQAKCYESRDNNLNNIESSLENYLNNNKNANLDLLVLPELHNNLYFCQNKNDKYFNLSESIPGYTTYFLSKLAKKYNLVIVGSVFEKAADNIYYNTSIVLDKDGTLAGKYSKTHIPDDPEYNEQYYFTSSNLGFEPIETSIGKLGVLICFDQWFPEAARIMALKGARVLIYPTAIGYNPNDSIEEKKKQLESWQIVQRSHAVANNVFVISCNRTGIEHKENSKKHIDFWGNSFIAGPKGEILSHLDQQENNFISSNLDLSKIDDIRNIWTFFRDRKPKHYSGLIKK